MAFTLVTLTLILDDLWRSKWPFYGFRMLYFNQGSQFSSIIFIIGVTIIGNHIYGLRIGDLDLNWPLKVNSCLNFTSGTACRTFLALSPNFLKKVRSDSNFAIFRCHFGQRLVGIFKSDHLRDISDMEFKLFLKKLDPTQISPFLGGSLVNVWLKFSSGTTCRTLLALGRNVFRKVRSN